MSNRPKFLIIYTGGTFGMEKTANGYVPRPGHLQEIVAESLDFSRHRELPDFDIVDSEEIIDSADISPSDWNKLAATIERSYDAYDGFLVIHGTDTMAYTASALSFMLEGLSKPVMLTGSQIPLQEFRNDALGNLVTALEILGAHHHKLSEVTIFFGSRLLRSNRALKSSASEIEAFESPNYPALGRAAVDIELDLKQLYSPSWGPQEPLRLVRINPETTVSSCRLFPGISATVLEALLSDPADGLVLECYGAGNAPTRDPAFVEVLERATARGVVIVAVTQAQHGSAQLARYLTGRRLLDAGVVSGYDMTTEAALAKLLYLFGKQLPVDEVRAQIANSLRGELTHHFLERPSWAARDRKES